MEIKQDAIGCGFKSRYPLHNAAERLSQASENAECGEKGRRGSMSSIILLGVVVALLMVALFAIAELISTWILPK